jgi:hypothetical protein
VIESPLPEYIVRSPSRYNPLFFFLMKEVISKRIVIVRRSWLPKSAKLSLKFILSARDMPVVSDCPEAGNNENNRSSTNIPVFKKLCI